MKLLQLLVTAVNRRSNHQTRAPWRAIKRRSASAHVISISGKAKLGHHQIGEAQRHKAVDFGQPVQAIRSLKKVFWTVPHALVPTTGLFFQVTEVYGFDEDPRGFSNVAVFLQIHGDSKIHGNVVAVLRLIHQLVHRLGEVLEKLQVASVEEGGADQHHGISVVRRPESRVRETALISAHRTKCGGGETYLSPPAVSGSCSSKLP